MGMQEAFEAAVPQLVATAWDYVERHEAVDEIVLGIAFQDGDSAAAPLYLVGDEWLLADQVGDLGVDDSSQARRELADALRGAANELAHNAAGDPMPALIVVRFETAESAMSAEFGYPDPDDDSERVPVGELIARWAQDQQSEFQSGDDEVSEDLPFEDAFTKWVPELIACAFDAVDRDERVDELMVVVAVGEEEVSALPVYSVDGRLLQIHELQEAGLDFSDEDAVHVRNDLSVIAARLLNDVDDESDEVPTLMLVQFDVASASLDARFSDVEQPGVEDDDVVLSTRELAELWAVHVTRADADTDEE